ncbi:hypothetical protein MTOK_53730 [Mycolicibacterium tokaiense]|nr:hypothetical protein MTOK_53730 [Mycolicibacterium tokaiense]
MTTEALPRRGQRDLLSAAVEQADPEFTLEFGHRRRQRRLHHVNAVCGPGEAELTGDGDEVFELAQFHGDHIISDRDDSY